MARLPGDQHFSSCVGFRDILLLRKLIFIFHSFLLPWLKRVINIWKDNSEENSRDWFQQRNPFVWDLFSCGYYFRLQHHQFMLAGVIMKMRILLDTILPETRQYQLRWVRSFHRHFLGTPSSHEPNRQESLPVERLYPARQPDKQISWHEASSAIEENKAGKRGMWRVVQLFDSAPQHSHICR